VSPIPPHDPCPPCPSPQDVATQPLEKLAPVVSAPLQRHIFVCTGSACASHDSQATLESFWSVLAERGLLYGKRGSLEGTVIVTTCGSVGLCAVGPAVLVYPDGVWYHHVQAHDVAEIVDEHLIHNRPVQRLLAFQLGTGAKK